MNHLPITLIKLGGSVITNKDIPMSLRQDVLTRLIDEIARAYQQKKNEEIFILGHGQGSYAHVPAQEYQTIHGFIHKDARFGMAVVQDSAAQLNRIVVHECIRRHLPAVSFYASNTIVTKDRKVDSSCLEVLKEYIRLELLPVTCGDVLTDTDQGCTIWSTEEILGFFAREFAQDSWTVNKIVHVTEVDGFLDHQKKLVPTITKQTWPELKSAIESTKGFDVTGGMGLKVEESLSLAEIGVPSIIVNGLKKDNVYNLLTGSTHWTGTTIAPNLALKRKRHDTTSKQAYL